MCSEEEEGGITLGRRGERDRRDSLTNWSGERRAMNGRIVLFQRICREMKSACNSMFIFSQKMRKNSCNPFFFRN